ncbi:olfactory receptor 4P4-like [Macrotis lagotis]|uniref:olfactory receptor 4P4-like n=1 Tax=Macrotis lagotis TaxID=92651 RepID=UPI003D6866F1
MEIQNNVTEFIFLGLLMDPEMKIMSCMLFMLCYFAIFLGNFIIFVTITCSHLIHQPMYYFLCHLSLMDLAYTSTIIPRLVRDLAAKRKNISFNSCMTQLFTGHFLAGVEMLILVSMAFDRYVAICKPLHYMVIVTRQKCNMLVLLAWWLAFWHSLAQMLMVLHLPFCGSNEIDHYICDVKPLLKLVCGDTYVPSILVIANSGMVALATFLVLLASYIVILFNLRKRSSEVRRKALSTCGSYVMVVVLFFVPCIAIYVPPPSIHIDDKEITLFYAVITPLLNPLIYTLRNTEMKNAMRKIWNQKWSS